MNYSSYFDLSIFLWVRDAWSTGTVAAAVAGGSHEDLLCFFLCTLSPLHVLYYFVYRHRWFCSESPVYWSAVLKLTWATEIERRNKAGLQENKLWLSKGALWNVPAFQGVFNIHLSLVRLYAPSQQMAHVRAFSDVDTTQNMKSTLTRTQNESPCVFLTQLLTFSVEFACSFSLNPNKQGCEGVERLHCRMTEWFIGKLVQA